MDYADRHGILVIDEAPAVGLNIGLGGGIFGAQGYTTFSPDTVNDETREVHAQVIRELVDRDKNRPSVVLWSIANEPESDTEGAERYIEPLFAHTRELDPGQVDSGSGRPFVDVVLDAAARDRLPARLVPGMREFFGAHTCRRVDRDGVYHHTLWSGDRSEQRVS